MLDRIQITTEVAVGLPAQYILAAARSGEVDLTVLCSHGRTGFTRWVLGSVAHTLAHESIVPTLVLHENETASLLAHPDAARPLRVLVPLDGLPLAEAALEPAAYLVASLATQGELHLTQVVKPFQTSAEEGIESSLNAEARARARTYLTQMTERWQAMALDHFPNARAVAAPAVAKAMQAQIDPDYLKNFWETRFPGQIPHPLVVPEALDSDEFELEGQKLVVIDDGFTDTDHSTSLYVPSSGVSDVPERNTG
jgi:nucleotide-binding universal stress UspA family protein